MESISFEHTGPSQKFFECLKLSFLQLNKVPVVFERLLREFLKKEDIGSSAFVSALSSLNVYFENINDRNLSRIIQKFIKEKFNLKELLEQIKTLQPDQFYLFHQIRGAHIIYLIQ